MEFVSEPKIPKSYKNTQSIKLIKKFNETNSHKIFTLETCPIYLENKAEIIINKCGHQVYCIECLAKSNKTNCPMYRGSVDMFFSYA